MTRGLPKHLRTERRILEFLKVRNYGFEELCFELNEPTRSVRNAVQRLTRSGWIQLIPGHYYAAYTAVTGAIVGWVREQET